MHSVLVALLVVTFISILCLILIFINNRQRKKNARDLVSRISKLGEDKNLTFSKVEVVGQFVIGLDEVKSRIMVLTRSETNYDPLEIDLRDVESCSKRNIYKRIDVGTAKRNEFENYVDEILLLFEFHATTEQLNLRFYESGVNSLMEMSDLDQKAKDWETIITATIKELKRKRA